MGVTHFAVEFDRDVFYSGQVVSGRVLLRLDEPKDIRALEFKLRGEAKFHWNEDQTETDSEGRSHTVSVKRTGNEKYINTEMYLVGGKGKTFELPIGEYTYPFSVVLPTNVPSTFNGQYGGISYFGKAKLDVPWAIDKKVKRFFEVQNLLNLNNFPTLRNPFQSERSKTFCCWCCASGPLTLVVRLPRTGYAFHESIPITVEVDNASNVDIYRVGAKLYKKIHWQANNNFSKHESTELRSIEFGSVSEGSSNTWTENLQLGPDRYPNLTGCSIIDLTYKLEIEADPSGAHTDLEIHVPITIGDIGFDEVVPNQYPGGIVAPGGNLGFNNPSAVTPNQGVGFVTPNAPTQSFPAPTMPGAPAPYPPQPGATPFPPQPGVAPYPQPGATQYPSQPGAAQYPSQPGAAQYPSQPDATQYPSQPDATQYPSQPGAAQYPQQPGASPYPPQQPGVAQYPSQQPGTSPYPPQQHGAIQHPSQGPNAPYQSSGAVQLGLSDPSAAAATTYTFTPDAPSAPSDMDLSLNSSDLFKTNTVGMPSSSFLNNDPQFKDEKAGQFTPLLPQNESK